MIFNIFKKNQPEKNPQKKEASRGSGLFDRLKQGLSKTRTHFQSMFSKLLGIKKIDDDNRNQLLRALLLCDIGPQTAEFLICEAEERLQTGSAETAQEAVKQALSETLSPSSTPWTLPNDRPVVLLFVGVNGSGKTTTIGRMSHILSQQGLRVGMAAGDTFRAAAIDQIKAWGDRTKTPVIAQKPGADSASVLFEGIQAAKTKPFDVLLGDTAGRLHNKTNLMHELTKVKKVIQKQIPEAPHETWLVIDATVGQNGLKQAQEFKKSTDVTGVILTKLDGTAKGGIVFSISRELGLPVRFIGVGEQASDLIPFDRDKYIDALLTVESE